MGGFITVLGVVFIRDMSSYSRSFNLLKSAEYEDFILYASHSVWEDEKAFRAWTESEEFRSAHRQAKAPKGTYASHPELETFTSIL